MSPLRVRLSTRAKPLILAGPTERAKHSGQAYELTGSGAFNPAEIAEILSGVAGRQIGHVDGEQAFVAHCAEIGVPDMLRAVYREAGEGWFSKVEAGPFVDLVGRSPRSFVHFAIDYTAHFAER